MQSGKSVGRCAGPALLALALWVLAIGVPDPARAQTPGFDSRSVQAGQNASGTTPGVVAGQAPSQGGSPYRVADRIEPLKSLSAQAGAAQPNEHPLMPALRWASEGIKGIEALKDYSATVVKRERVKDKVGEYEYMFVKVRHQPFSVYAYFLGPTEMRGREVIYIKGANGGKMWAHTTGVTDTFIGTLSLAPDGPVAMQGQRYPLTEIGLLNLTRRLVEVAQQDVNYGECEVKFFKGAKINNRSCTLLQVIHPVPRRNFRFHLARIFADDELNVPIRYEAYDWPREKGAMPELIEEYTYVNLKLNNGFSDADFDVKNPKYHFH